MKVPAALLTLALAGAAVAQDGFGLPECANNCANKFLQNGIGNCGKDIKCICEDKSFLGEIACCLTDACNEADQKAAVAAAANICDAVGVKGLPTEVACATASAASTTASRTGSGTAPAPTGTGANAATQNPAAQSTTTSESTNFGPRPTAAAGLGAIGGIIAAVALL